ncbi:hypothetical protein IW147_000430 [Coemansia sp. RSA 720]|nr:hypothetical protein IW147_000430 [Coemansia sp. RSA 720]
MPNYQVVRCADDKCGHFQSQQEKKTPKWKCVVCGLKQSLKRVHFQSATPKECRAVVMDLNMNRGHAEAAKKQRTNVAGTMSIQPATLSTSSFDKDMPNLHDRDLSPLQMSKWDDFAEDEEPEPTNEANVDLDSYNRIVIGRVENDNPASGRSQTKQKVTMPTKPPTNVPNNSNVPKSTGQSVFSQALAAMTPKNGSQRPAPQQRHVPQQRPAPHQLPVQATTAPAPRKRILDTTTLDQTQAQSRWDCYASDSDSASD